MGQAGAVDGFADALNRMNELLRSGQLDSIFDRIGVAVGALASFVATAAENFRPLLTILALIAGRRIAPLFIALAAALGTIPAKARAAAAGMTVLGAQSAAAASGMTLAATATRGLRVALTALLSATGIGALVALVSAGIALWVTRTEEATDAQNQHLKIVDQVKNAYDAVGDSVVQLRDRLQDVTATQALRNLQRLEEQLQNLREEIVDAAKPGVFEAFGDRLSRLYGGRESRARAVMAGAVIQELEILSQRFLAGEFGSTRLRQEIDRLVTTFGNVSPALATQAAQLLDIVDRFDLVNGRVAQAQFIYTGLTGTVEVAGEAFRRVAKETAAVANPLERQLKALEAFQIGLQALTTELPGGENAAKSREAAEALGSQVEELRRLASEAGVGEEAVNALYEQILQFQRADEIFEGASSGLSAIGRILEEGTELSSTAIAEQALVIRNHLAASVGEGIVEALTSRQQAVLGAVVQAFGELPEGLAGLVQQGVEQGSSSGVAQFVRSLEGLPNANLLATVFGGEDFDIDALIQAEERLATLRERNAERQRQQQARLAEQERQRIERAREATQQTIDDLDFQIQQQSLVSIGEQRRAAIEESLRNARQQNANISVQELQAIENRVGLLFDIENRERIIAEGRERAAAAEQKLNDLLDLRSQLTQELEIVQERGLDPGRAAELAANIEGVSGQIREAVENATALAEVFDDGTAAAAALLSRLRQVRDTLDNVGTQGVISFQQIEQIVGNAAGGVLDTFVERLKDGVSGFVALRDAALEFVADILSGIAKVIAQQAILNALGFGGSGGPTGFAGFIAGFLGHEGGVVTRNGIRPPSAGRSGLSSGDVPAILQEGEQVLAADDPSNILNNGQGGAGGTTIINAIDGPSFLDEALQSRSGSQTLLNFISANQRAVRNAAGIA